MKTLVAIVLAMALLCSCGSKPAVETTVPTTAPVVEKTGFPWWIPFALLGVGSIIAIVILKKKS